VEHPLGSVKSLGSARRHHCANKQCLCDIIGMFPWPRGPPKADTNYY